MTVIVFDLDDTLYEEIDFVKSGFDKVSKFLFKNYHISKDECYQNMINELGKGRGKIFDNTLKKYNIFTQKLLRQCISIYRLHKPKICLFDDAEKCLKQFNTFPMYIVTDGNKIVQKNKLQALKLEKIVKFSFITSNYGLKNSKPSTYCFLKICKLENTSPENIVYIGDDPSKDFVEIKKIGFKTIRVLTGKFKNKKYSNYYDADLTIKSLKELSVKKIIKLMENNSK